MLLLVVVKSEGNVLFVLPHAVPLSSLGGRIKPTAGLQQQLGNWPPVVLGSNCPFSLGNLPPTSLSK